MEMRDASPLGVSNMHRQKEGIAQRRVCSGSGISSKNVLKLNES